jgi:dethiobiotin synthetase
MALIFVTGSDTDVGKTHVAGLLARRLSRDGLPMIQVDQQDVAVGADVSSELKKPLSAVLTPAGQAASAEIHSLIQMYYEWMR